MAKRHYIPITADVEGVDSDRTRALIRKAIRTALTAEGVTVPCEVDVLLTNDAGIHQINLDMREVDRPTDVLSFPIGELDYDTGRIFLGDMVLSLERAEAQSVEFGGTFEHEVQYLTVHSVLHLLGYDHLDEGEQKAAMRAREKEIMKRLGYDY